MLISYAKGPVRDACPTVRRAFGTTFAKGVKMVQLANYK